MTSHPSTLSHSPGSLREGTSATSARNRREDAGQLTFDGVSIVYPPRAGRSAVVAVDAVDLTIAAGEFVVLVGPSGCGKTSLLKAAAALQPVTSGQVRIGGSPVHAGRTHGISVVFQSPRLLPWLSIESNVAIPLEAAKIPRRERLGRARREIEAVGLAGFERAFPSELSGGMQQRANLARALANDAQVLLLDEPFAALDAQTREQMQAQLLDLWAAEARTAMFITHQVDEAVYLADRVVVLSARPGRIREIIDIPFARPRTLDIKRTTEFHAIEDHIWMLLRDEERASAEEST